MRRSELAEAPYNPRSIGERERKNLRNALKALGLLEPLVWNKRTGKLVGGHQRLKILDGLANGARDYTLTVAQVDLSDAEEVEANIALNNTSAMGQYESDKLMECLRAPGLRIEATGFDRAQIYQMFGSSPLDGEVAQAAAEAAADKLRELDAAIERTAAKGKSSSADFYLVVLFRAEGDADRFLAWLGLDDNRYQDGELLRSLIARGIRADGTNLRLDGGGDVPEPERPAASDGARQDDDVA